MASKVFVLVNVPELEDKENYLTDILETVLELSVESLELHPAVPDRALITFKDDCLDLDEANHQLSEQDVFHVIRLEFAIQKNTLIVDRRQYSYFEFLAKDDAGGKNVACQTFSLPESEMIAVVIENSEVYKNILTPKAMPMVVDIKVYYHNFHGLIPVDGQPLSNAVDQAFNRPKVPPKPLPKPKSVKGFIQKSLSIFTNSKSDGKKEENGANISEDFPTSHGENENALSHSSADNTQDQKPFTGGIKVFPTLEQKPSPKPNLEVQDRDKDSKVEMKEKMMTHEEVKDVLASPQVESVSNISFSVGKGMLPSFEPPVPSKPKVEDHPKTIHKSESMDIDQHIWNLIQNKIAHPDLFHEKEYDTQRMRLKFKSHDVAACHKSINELKADIITGSPLVLPENMIRLFQRLKTSDFLESCFFNYFQEYEVQCILEKDSIKFYGWDVESIDKTKEEVESRFLYSDEVVNESCMSVEDIRKMKKESEYEYWVDISWQDSQASKIQIEGVFDDVMIVKQHISSIVTKHMTMKGFFEFPQNQCLFVNQHCQERLASILQNVTIIFNGIRDDKYCIEFSGVSTSIKEINRSLNDFKISIKSENIDVAKEFDQKIAELITIALQQKKTESSFIDMRTVFESDHRCCIINDVEVDSQSQRSPVKTSAPHSKNPPQAAASSHSHPKLSPNLQIEIKSSGNIIKENADVLVCVLHESKKLQLVNMSKAFLKAIPDLQTTVDELDFSSNQVQFYKVNSSKLSCKYIAFTLLSPFSDGSSKYNLKPLISEVLVKAAESGSKSVTFPPLGLGVVLKYPRKIIAKQFFSAFKHCSKNRTVTAQLMDIKIVANDKDLYNDLQPKLGRLRLPSYNPDDDNVQQSANGHEQEEINFHNAKASITIVHSREDTLAPLWKDKLNASIIDDEYTIQMEKLPKVIDDKLKKKLKYMVLNVKRELTDTSLLKFVLKGVKDDVLEIKSFIANELHRYATHVVHICSEHAPKRGTLEFVQYAAGIEESAPSYWKYKIKSKLQKNKYFDVDVGDKTSQAIEKLFMNTWDSNLAGHGNDARGIPKQSKVQVVGVKRVENLTRFGLYAAARKAVFQKKAEEQEICKSISKTSAKSQGNVINDHLPDFMKAELYDEINECYLLHGTKPEIVDPIKANGCDPLVSSAGAMFGKGVYAAESSTKSDQYTDSPTSRLPSGSLHYMFLVRMLMGDIFLCDDKHPSLASKDCAKLIRAPCKSCQKDKCYCGSYLYDSVLGEGKWLFREYVVYKDYHCYPEYIIIYKRI